MGNFKLINVQSLSKHSDVGLKSILAIILSVIVFTIVSISTENLIGDFSILVASIFAVGFLYGYFFLLVSAQSYSDVTNDNRMIAVPLLPNK